MPKRSSKKRIYHRYVESSENIRNIALKVICDESGEATPAGCSRSSNELTADENNEQTPAPAVVTVEGIIETNKYDKKVEIVEVYEEVTTEKDEEMVDKEMGSQDNTALTPFEEPEEQNTSQPLELSFPNFIPHPVSIGLRHFTSSSRHAPALDNMASGWNRALQASNNFATSYFPSSGSSRFPPSGSSRFPSPGSPHYLTSGSSYFPPLGSSRFLSSGSSHFPPSGSSHYPPSGSSHFYPSGSSHFRSSGSSPPFPSSVSPHFPSSVSPHFPSSGSPNFPSSGSPHFHSPGSPHYMSSGSSHFPSSVSPHYPSSGSPLFPSSGSPDQRLMNWTPRTWGMDHGQMPMLNSYQSPFIANEAQYQGGYLNFRPWQNSNSPQWINAIGDLYSPPGFQRQSANSNAWRQPAPLNYGVDVDPPYAGGSQAGLQPQAGYVDPGLGYNANNAGFGNAYRNNQYQQQVTQRPPHPWELQKPIGFQRMKALKNKSNEEAGPSNAVALGDVQESQVTVSSTGKVPTNSGAIPKKYKQQKNRTRSGKPNTSQDSVNKMVINDNPVAGTCSSISGGKEYRCQMCDSKVDTEKSADLRYCSDCFYYNYCWK